MSLQARFSPDEKRLYSVSRDVAHNFKFVVEEVARRLENGAWPELDILVCPGAGFSTEAFNYQLGQACEAFIAFVAGAVEHPKEDMFQSLERSGWFKTDSRAQIAFMAYLGQVLAGIYFHGAREATMGGDGPCSDIKTLVAAGRRSSYLMRLPRWRRPWHRLYWRFCGALRGWRGKEAQNVGE